MLMVVAVSCSRASQRVVQQKTEHPTVPVLTPSTASIRYMDAHGGVGDWDSRWMVYSQGISVGKIRGALRSVYAVL